MGKGLHVRKNDRVVVICGDDKGREGRILGVEPSKQRIVVEGVHFIKRHMRRSQKHPKGGVVEREAPIHVSNVKLVQRAGEAREPSKSEAKA